MAAKYSNSGGAGTGECLILWVLLPANAGILKVVSYFI
jgi:hypothetical protein